MRILIVDGSDRGGIAIYTGHLVDELRHLGLDVHLCAPGDRAQLSPSLTDASWTASGSPSKGARFYMHRATQLPIQAAALLKAVRTVKPDLVHFQTSVVRRADHMVNAYIRHQVPVVLTIHNPVPHENASLESRLERRRWSSADALIVHSDEARHVVEREVPSKPVYVTPVDLYGPVAGVSRSEARRRLELDTTAPIALALGLVRPYKGFRLLAQSWPAVRSALPRARLFVVGAAQRPFEDIDRLLDLAGVEGRLDWLSDEDVHLWATASDVCVLPYDHGSHSGVLHRAVANGTPVLASPPLADEVTRFGAGKVVELTPQAWTLALIEVLGIHPLASPKPGGARGIGTATSNVYHSVQLART